MQRTPLKRTLALLLAAVAGGAALATGAAAPAAAHAALTATDPEDGAVLAEAPAEFAATFSENLDGPSTEIAVTDPAGAVVDVAGPAFDGDTFTQPMRYTVPGEYTVAFRVISEDGHRVDDTVSFTVESIPEGLYAPGAEPTGAASSEAASTAATSAPATEAPSESAEAAGESEESNPGATLAAILLGVLVVVGGGVILVKTVGRKPHRDEPRDGAAPGEERTRG